MNLRRYGVDALLVELASTADRAALDRALLEAPFVAEVVPGEVTLLVRAKAAAELPAIAQWIRGCDPPPVRDVDGRLHTIPVTYDGVDLDAVALSLGLSTSEVVNMHTRQQWRVEFLGFMPGFGYLTGDDTLTVSRRAQPRTKIPRGSVALAGRYCGIYPSASPGGWQLIGTSNVRLFDATASQPALWQPGDRVQFVQAPHA